MKQTIQQIQELNSKVKKSNNQVMQVDNRTYVQEWRQGSARKKVIIQLLANPKNFISKDIQIRMQRDQLDHQFQIQSSVSSPYIIKPFNMFIENKKIVWISENFHCFLNQLPISQLNFEQRFLIFYDIAHGVKDLSRHLICHRSLSPNSISIIKNQSGRLVAKINNFSTATSFKAEKDLSEQGIQEINPFSAPELVSKSANGLPVDIWSLGCLLNYLLYEGLHNIKRTAKQEVVIQVPESTPTWLQDLLSSMITIHPNKRAKIKTVIELIKPMQKCKEVLSKYVPVGCGVFQIKRQGN